MFSDRTIKKSMERGDIKITPEPNGHQMQPASIDLRLSESFIRIEQDRDFAFTSQHLLIEPGECLLASTLEQVTLSSQVIGRIEGKSTWGRKFLMVHATAGFIDPGFSGQITLELKNIGPRAVALYPEIMICQISFDWLSCPADRTYGTPGLRSKYQGQVGPTPALMVEPGW